MKRNLNLIYKESIDDIDWKEVPRLLELVGMGFTDAEKHRISFENSFAAVFVFDTEKMIGLGRLISDGIRQSALYDIAVDPEYQGYGVGRRIVELLINKTPGCNFILYASPGKEDFYRKLNFRKMKTGMALFADPHRMSDGGFIEE
ncbi:GNAT family N-acetyltransferase [Dysgonomonas macrotermitis]|uniref:Acetyltransferase (GNAT) domain-containing protein n=1 Tax=Dysgonomonas macrotermitis TaxID=1346286 RepID=A0A1M5H4N8_9BACT|nr:GNAT family N-acetyltransferase [Dysgonomonas macrotermitis]SHG10914.1 Acetyltransferase (GNAT) domain-containing protein [Dysgonomonas macrotermitis]